MRSPCMVMLGVGQVAGLACARRFAETKWSVMIVDGDQKNLDRAEKELGDLCSYLHEDQHTKLGLKNGLAGTIDEYDGVDCVVTIPPLPDTETLQDMTLDAMKALYHKGAISMLMAAKTFSQEMIREIEWEADQVERPVNDKSFVTILSRLAIASDYDRMTTSVSHGAVLSVMKALAIELAPYRIRSNSVLALRPRAEGEDNWLASRTPLARSPRPDELANMAYFLASPEARFITGQTIELDGGRSVLNGVVPD
jgi:Dehydrogenases with different specificities (related to short-chain alcohol dehydrogenases)